MHQSTSLHVLLGIICLGHVTWGLDRSSVMQQISSKQESVNRILDYVLEGAGKNAAYNRLADLTDRFGHRVLGSDSLEKAIDHIIQKMGDEGFANVAGEEAVYPKWVRKTESAQLLSPFNKTLGILGLGTTVPTGSDGITAGVIVVDDYDELNEKVDQDSDIAKGKIVVYNNAFTTYGETNIYRTRGASEASKVGAVAALVRSVTPYSLYTPHTGAQSYADNVDKIPVAAITIEDAEMLKRMYLRGQNVTVHLLIESEDAGNTTSRNVVAEITGSVYPEEVVIIGGHIDSWDVGTGAMDDGGGVMISWEALSIIQKLNLRPKRTIRTVFWTAEEEGLYGATEYFKRHNATLMTNLSLIMESDSGTFKPNGLFFTGNPAATEMMQAVMNLLGRINTTSLGPGGAAPDTGIWVDEGVPGGQPDQQNEKYFYYHHTEADTITLQDPHYMDLCTAMWAAVTYAVADLDIKLPRGEEAFSTVNGATQNNSMATIITCMILLTIKRLIS